MSIKKYLQHYAAKEAMVNAGKVYADPFTRSRNLSKINSLFRTVRKAYPGTDLDYLTRDPDIQKILLATSAGRDRYKSFEVADLLQAAKIKQRFTGFRENLSSSANMAKYIRREAERRNLPNVLRDLNKLESQYSPTIQKYFDKDSVASMMGKVGPSSGILPEDAKASAEYLKKLTKLSKRRLGLSPEDISKGIKQFRPATFRNPGEYLKRQRAISSVVPPSLPNSPTVLAAGETAKDVAKGATRGGGALAGLRQLIKSRPKTSLAVAGTTAAAAAYGGHRYLKHKKNEKLRQALIASQAEDDARRKQYMGYGAAGLGGLALLYALNRR